MGRSSEAAGSSSSSWTGFFLGSAVTATAMLVYQNRQYLLDLYLELREEERDSKAKKHGSSRALRGLRRSTVSSASMIRNQDERAGFLSDILKELWPYINIAGSDTIRTTAEPMFKEMMPGPLSTLHFTKVDLGTVPIRLDNVDIHEVDLDNNTLQFDMDFVWDGNCDIRLKANYMGSFGIKEVNMKGRMSILMRPLMPTTDLVAGIQYGFINTPKIHLKYSGLVHLADFKLIKNKIEEILAGVIDSMMVVPRRRLYKMDQGCEFQRIFKAPLGVARINVISGRGFVIQRGFLADDIPDCYCVVSMGDATRKTSTIMDNLEPQWNESLDYLLCDHDQVIKVQCWDEDDAPLDADDDLGIAFTTPGEIALNGHTTELELQQDDGPTGAFVTIGYEMLNFTADLHSLTTTNSNHMCGLLTVLVLRAFEIPLSKDEASTFVQVSCGRSHFATSAVVDYPGVDCLNPWFDSAFLVELTPAQIVDGKIPDIKFQLINGVDTDMGILVVTHAELVSAVENTIVGTQNIGGRGAKLQFHICLQGVKKAELQKPESLVVDASTDGSENWTDVEKDLIAAGARKSTVLRAKSPLASFMISPRDISQLSSSFASEESEQFSDPIGEQPMVRITAVSGRGFAIRKKPLFFPDDIPDVYMKISFGSSPHVWRTATIQDNQFPVWNEHKDYPLQSHGQVIDLEVYEDDEKKENNPYYGSIRTTVGKCLLAGGTLQQEVINEGRRTGIFITIKCQLI